MAESKLRHALLGIVLAVGIGSGCDGREHQVTIVHSRSSGEASDNSAPLPASPAVSGKRVTDRPANEKGKVFIVEYHHIREGKNDMFRSATEFRGDLERLYKDGFRPCTVSAYLENRMGLPPGASPAVFTFDDATPSQIRFLSDGSLDPTCAVGIWRAFAKLHPDFPVRATFYVLPDTMWGQSKFVSQKIALVKQLGCELGNHTVTHPILKRKTDEQVEWEIATATDDLAKLGTALPISLALPYGVSPKNRALLKSFTYKGKTYAMKAVMLVGAEPARSPLDPKFDRYRIPRIQAYNGPSGLNEWLGRFEKGGIKTYVAP